MIEAKRFDQRRSRSCGSRNSLELYFQQVADDLCRHSGNIRIAVWAGSGISPDNASRQPLHSPRITPFCEGSGRNCGTPQMSACANRQFGGLQMMIARKIGTFLASAALLATALALGGQAAADGLKDTKPSADVYRGVWFGGFDVVEGAHYMFQGVLVALNRDLSKDGFALRTYGSRVDFDQDPTGDGRGWQGDVMLGYLFHRGPVNGAIYVGGDYQNYKLSPDDPTALVRGVDWGFKVAGDLATSTDQPIYFALSGSYSTAFDSYWARLRYGFNRTRYIFGAEAQAFGNEEFDAQRLGAFLTFNVDLRPGTPLEITLSGGHQFVKDSGGGTTGTGGGEGTYATLVFSMPF